MKKIIIITVASLVVLVGGLMYTKTTKANPLFFPATVQTSSATTSPAYMTAGTATSTLTWDSYAALGTYTGTLKSTLLIQLVASSTATVLTTNIEYSQDGIDWYQSNGLFAAGFSTTTNPIDIGQVNQFKFAFASSTAGLAGLATTTATTTRAIPVVVPTRFVRAIFSLAPGSTAGAVWGQFVPVKERAE